MTRILQRRIPWLVVSLLGVTTITFFLINLVPGGPFSQLEGGGRALSPEIIAQINKFYGLDQPVWRQYLVYMQHLLQGNLGRSLLDNEQVSVLILQGLPVSAQLGLAAAGVALLIGIPLGVLAAVKKNSWVDQLTTSVSILGICIPSFVMGFILIIVFALYLSWVPVAGWGTWKQRILPIAALSMEPIALFSRYTRASLLDVLGEMYVTVARSKGLPERIVLFKHALKNAFVPIATVLGLVIPGLIVGSFLIETVFAVPGTGRFFVVSISRRDYPVIMGTAILYATIVTLTNLLVDIIYVWLDPRIRYD
jgi:oligopeptide transport system permease protein